MALTDPRALFAMRLGETMYVEQRLIEILPELASQAKDKRLRQNLEHHREETEQQLDNLHRIAEGFDGGIDPIPSAAFDGLVKDHERLMGEKPDDRLTDHAITDSVLRNEHLEIGSYEGLIVAASQLGETDAVELLRRNLGQEKHTAEEIHGLKEELAKELTA